MAIEFNCPYCTATVRVGLDAAGKIGRCPKCETRIRIPGVEIPPTAEPPAPAPPSPSVTPQAPPVSSPPEAEPPPAFPDLTQHEKPVEPTPLSPDGLPLIQATEPHVTKKYIKKKKRFNWGPLIPPLLFGSVFLIIGIVWWAMNRPDYTGELTGSKIDPNQVITVSIQGSMYNIPKKTFADLVDELRNRPSAVRSNLVNLRFDAGAGSSLKVSLRPGVEADLISVPIFELEDIDAYYQDHFSKLDDERLRQLQEGLNSLCDDWTKAPENQKLKSLPDYRDKIAYNAFVKGLGYYSEAVVQVDPTTKQFDLNGIPGRYPCIHEDGSGSIAFLVPVGTTEFIIRTKKNLKTNFFPSKYEIKVRVPLPTTTPEVITETPAEVEPIPVDESLIEPEEGSEMMESKTENSDETEMNN